MQYDLRNAGMLRRSWLVVLFAVLGFLTSMVIHITAYYQMIPVEFFLLYCRVEWLGVALVAFLLGVWMPSTTPRRQLVILLRWAVVACIALPIYFAYCAYVFVVSPHPVKDEDRYVVRLRGHEVREIGRAEYHRLAEREQRFYTMYLNRAFSLVWVIMFFGMSLYGFGYLREQRRMGLQALSPEKYVPWWYGGI